MTEEIGHMTLYRHKSMVTSHNVIKWIVMDYNAGLITLVT